MITEIDAKNIMALLDRVPYQGLQEANLAVELANKLNKIKDDAAQDTDTASE